jgi:hypothetical protein
MLCKDTYAPHNLAIFVHVEVYCVATEGAVVDLYADLSLQADWEWRIWSLRMYKFCGASRLPF